MENENETTSIPNLAVNVVNCREENFQQFIKGIIETVKSEMKGFNTNLQINLYLQNGDLITQLQENLPLIEENIKWKN